MGGDRFKYVMSVELAMKREMAYRQKKGGSSCTEDTPRKDPLPCQVQTLASSQVPRTMPGPTPNPCPPTPALIPNPRPHPLVAPRPEQVLLQRHNPQHHGPIPGSFSLTRPLPLEDPHSRPSSTSGSAPGFIADTMPHPQVEHRPEHPNPQDHGPIPGSFPLARPLSLQNLHSRPSSITGSSPGFIATPRLHPQVGHRPEHLNPLHQQPFRGSTLPAGPRPLFQGPPSRPGPACSAKQKRKMPLHHKAPLHKRNQVNIDEDVYCHICKVDCGSEVTLRMHLRGHKHKAKVKTVKAVRAAGGALEAIGMLYCEVCEIRCQDENAMAMHLRGKNHILKLHTLQKKMVGADGGSAVLLE